MIENKTHAVVVIRNNIAYCIVRKTKNNRVFSEKVIDGFFRKVRFVY